jgi:hypothetical protein
MALIPHTGVGRTILQQLQIELPENFWPLIASAAGTAWPPGGAGEARKFIRQCVAEAALPLLFATGGPAEVNAELGAWRALDAANRQRTASLTRAIAGLPSRIGDDFILLKGSDVSHRLYPAPELRPMGDIDVLVPIESMPLVTERLVGNGARIRYWRLTHFSAANPDRAFDLGDLTLEVHHSIVHRASARIDYGSIWRSRVRTSVAGVELSRLADADALLAAALNLAKDNLAGPLLRFLDLWLMLKGNPCLASEAAARAREWRVENALYTVLRIASTLFPELGPLIAPRRRLDWLVVPRDGNRTNDVRRISRATRLWRKFWLLDGFDLPLRYVAALTRATAYGLWRRAELESASGGHAPVPVQDSPGRLSSNVKGTHRR